MALVGTINSSNTLGFKNPVINGGFDFWQRGTSGSTAASFVADRWSINSNNTSHARSSDVPTGFRYSLLMTGTSASNAQATQKIESLNCNGLVGEPITVSFWAKSTSGSTQLGCYISHCNSENNFGSTTSIGSTTNFTLTSTWTRYSVTFTSSAPAGVLNGIQLGLFRNGTESSATYITGVQLEDSSVATPFEFKPYAMELALCQRYFYVAGTNSGGYTITLGHGISPGGSSVWRASISIPVPLRTTPSITETNIDVWNPSVGSTAINTISTIYYLDGGIFLEVDLTTTSAHSIAGGSVAWLQTKGSGGKSTFDISAEL